jgi:hypothetical protein
MLDVKEVRRRAFHYLSTEVAAIGEMDLHQLMQFAIGTYTPPDDELLRLARRMGVEDDGR